MHLYRRQRLLLSLLKAAGGELAATDFQKLLFLYTRKCENEPSFKFVPYRFGCFSFQSYADRGSLERKGLLYPAENGAWRLASKAAPHLDREETKRLKLFVERAVPERGDDLVAKVYREAPYYATRSTIIDRVFTKAADRKAVEKARPKSKGKALFTIGYEGDSIDGYLNRLIENDVRLLCDVRRNPLSRKTGFSKRQLANHCEKVGVDYRHVPELGIPSHRRRQLDSPEDYRKLFSEYESEDLPLAGDALTKVFGLISKHSRIALTCFEKEPEMCHRNCVAREISKKRGCPSPRHI